MTLEELLMEERREDEGLKKARDQDPIEAKEVEDEGPSGVRAYEIRRVNHEK